MQPAWPQVQAEKDPPKKLILTASTMTKKM